MQICIFPTNIFANQKETVKQEEISQDSTNNQVSNKDSKNFYGSLKSKAYKNWWTKEIYDLVFIAPEDMEVGKYIEEKDEEPYIKYQGKVIRSIHTNQINIFDTTMNVTHKIFSDKLKFFIDKVHIDTKAKVIRYNLLFEKGEVIDPSIFGDNERIIRELPFIKEVEFEIIEDSTATDSVDVLIITQDMIPIGLGFSIKNLHSGSLNMYNNNIFGLGQEIGSTISLDTKSHPKFQYIEGIYKIYNINGSFISGEFNYHDDDRIESYIISAKRNFIPPKIKLAGGFRLGRIRNFELVKDSTLLEPYSVFNHIGFGLGTGFPLSKEKRLERHIYTVPIVSVNTKKYIERPEVTATSNRVYHNETLILGGINLIKSDYYKSNWIYNFGQIEYIPYGYLFELVLGPNFHEFYNRLYTSVKFSKANYKRNFGYLYNKIALGGFFKDYFEEGVFDFKVLYTTSLLFAGEYKFRHFAELKYTLGIERNEDEAIDINEGNGIWGFKSDIVKGNQRLVLSMETVAFSPWYLCGFKFAFFGFLDIGIIGHDKEDIFKNKCYKGLGLGFKVRNEFLVFKTFQIRIGFYPSAPSGTPGIKFSLSGESVLELEDFEVSTPEVLPFE